MFRKHRLGLLALAVFAIAMHAPKYSWAQGSGGTATPAAESEAEVRKKKFLEEAAKASTSLTEALKKNDVDAAAKAADQMSIALAGLRKLSADEIVADLQRAGAALATVEQAADKTKVENALAALEGQIAVFRAENKYITWFTTAAQSIVDNIGETADEKKKTREITRRLLQNDPDAMGKAVEIKAAIELLQGGYRPRIHIIDALYGDLESGRYSKRTCEATLAMIAQCEGQQECRLPANYQTTLCGYDPVPAAEPRLRAVLVEYSCHIGGDPVWDELARYPRIDPDTLLPLNLSNPAVSLATLQGNTMEIRCPSQPFTQVVDK